MMTVTKVFFSMAGGYCKFLMIFLIIGIDVLALGGLISHVLGIGGKGKIYVCLLAQIW